MIQLFCGQSSLRFNTLYKISNHIFPPLEVTKYSRIRISRTLSFSKFPIIRTKLNFPSPVKHCNCIPDFSNFPLIHTNLLFSRWFEKQGFHCSGTLKAKTLTDVKRKAGYEIQQVFVITLLGDCMIPVLFSASRKWNLLVYIFQSILFSFSSLSLMVVCRRATFLNHDFIALSEFNTLYNIHFFKETYMICGQSNANCIFFKTEIYFNS